MSIFAKLKQRNILWVTLLYFVAAWLLLQIVDFLFSQLGVPDWAFRLVFALTLICFPLVISYSWVCEITPEGLPPDEDGQAEAAIVVSRCQKIKRVTVILLTIAILTTIADQWNHKRVSEALTTTDNVDLQDR